MQGADKGLFIAFVGLTLFGLIMMSSMSVAGSFEVTGRNDYYFWRHFWHIVVGIPVFFLAFRFPTEGLRKWSPMLYILAIVLLITVLVLGQSFGTAAKSWIRLGPLSFQPVEAAKLGVIVMLASLYSSGKMRASDLGGGLIPFMVVLGIPAVLIIAQPDFGSLLVLTTAAASVYFVAGANLKHFFGGVGLALGGGLLVALTNTYIWNRVAVFLNPELDPLGVGFQVRQAMIAIGSGGFLGRGFQNSVQKFDYLPEVQSDTIFAAIAEEMGFFRILILVGIYLYIAHRGFTIARDAPDDFHKLLATGLTTWIVGQAFINIGVNLALLPNTGITLPLISYGGSSLWATFIGFGILLRLSAQMPQKVRRKHPVPWYG